MIDSQSLVSLGPLRRVVVIDNHYPLIWSLASKSHKGLPLQLRNAFSAEDLYQESIAQVRMKLCYYDARKSAPVTFIHHVVTRGLQRWFQFQTRQQRDITKESEFEMEKHSPTIRDTTQPFEVVETFISVYKACRADLRVHIKAWLEDASAMPTQRMYRRFHHVAKKLSLTCDDVRTVLTNDAARQAVITAMEGFNGNN